MLEAELSYVVLIVLSSPTPWQGTSEAVYGPFATTEDAVGVIRRAVSESALRIVVLPLSVYSEPLEIQ